MQNYSDHQKQVKLLKQSTPHLYQLIITKMDLVQYKIQRRKIRGPRSLYTNDNRLIKEFPISGIQIYLMDTTQEEKEKIYTFLIQEF